MCKPNSSSSSLTRKIVARFDAEENCVMLDWEMTSLTSMCCLPREFSRIFDLLCYFTLITDSRTSHWQNIWHTFNFEKRNPVFSVLHARQNVWCITGGPYRSVTLSWTESDCGLSISFSAGCACSLCLFPQRILKNLFSKWDKYRLICDRVIRLLL